MPAPADEDQDLADVGDLGSPEPDDLAGDDEDLNDRPLGFTARPLSEAEQAALDELVSASAPPELEPTPYFDGAIGRRVHPRLRVVDEKWEHDTRSPQEQAESIRARAEAANGSAEDGEAAHEPGTSGDAHARDRPAWRTLADIPDDPPQPLLLGMFEPTGPTLPYAAPGVGKGTTGAWAIVELQKMRMRPAIFDAERRPREWARRVSGLGGDRSKVVYIEPTDLGRRHAGRPLWEVSSAIGDIIKEAGVDFLIVDSILPASGVGEEKLRSDPQTPYLYVAALDALGIPSLSFGHPPKGQPEGDPFGSMGWVAAMRLTWLGTRAEGDAHRVRWRPRKRNERGHIAGILLTFTYAPDGRPCGATREDDEESTRDWLLAALIRGPRSVADMADELAEKQEDHTTADALERIKERLGKALNRMAKDGAVVKDGDRGRTVKWSLKWTP